MTALMGAVVLPAVTLLFLEAIILPVDSLTVTAPTTTRASTVFATTSTFSLTDCGGSINGSGILSTPNYPYSYPNNAVCQWRLTASAGNVLQLQTPLLDLESNYDFLIINSTYSNKQSASTMRYSGVLSNFSLILGEQASVIFTSDSSVTKTGFMVYVSSVSPSVQSTIPFNDCGGNISGDGVVLSPNYPSSYPNNANCRWYFKANSGSLVTVSVYSLSLETGYDNFTVTSTSSNVSGSIQTMDVRSIYESPSRTLTLQTDEVVLAFQSDLSVQSQGFYVYVYSSVNSSRVLSTTGSPVTQIVPYDCGGSINGSGILSTPNYPYSYPNNAVCQWRLTASAGNVLQLQTPLLDLESNYDFLIINSTYSNKQSASTMRYSGVLSNFSLILGEQASVIFTSDSSVTKTGFMVYVSSVSPSVQSTIPFNDCGGNISGSGAIFSPNYPSPYPNNANCRWYFKANGSSTVTVSVYYLSLETGYDNLTVTSTSSNVSGSIRTIDVRSIYESPSRSLTLPTDEVVLVFQSDSSVQNQGFYVYLNDYSSPSVTTTDSLVTQIVPYECGGNITGQGRFTSPFYPSLYPNMATCKWYLKAAAAKVLKIDALTIDLEQGFDFLTFNTTYPNQTRSEMFRVTGYRSNFSFTLASEAYVEFTSDSSMQRTGFLVFVTSISAPPGFGTFYRECNTTITAPGTLFSPNYPNTYPLNADCQWTIRAPSRSVVKLTFLDFSITAPYDVLRIFQEENVTCGTPFTTYTGRSANGSVVLRQAAVIAFSSSARTAGTGFKLSVNFISSITTPNPAISTTTALPVTSCGATIRGSGRLRSPNYPLPYAANTKCVWKLNRQARWPCTLRINSLRLESPWDYLRVYLTDTPGTNDVPAAEYTGSITGITVSFNTTVLTVIFNSDESVELSGFDISFYSNSSSPRPMAVVAPVLPQPGMCGVPDVVQLTTSGNERIVGGAPAVPGEWPWQIMLYYDDAFICGGSVVASQWVLTAAHCIISLSPSSFTVSLGKHKRTGRDSTEKKFNIIKIIRHPAYDSDSDDSDLALLKLQRPVAFTAAIKPICLPTTDVVPGSMCYVTGWGKTESTGNNSILQKATIPSMSRQCCKTFLGGHFTKNMSCAGYLKGGKDTCQGDSGGPFVCKTNGIFWLYGITSWGIGCGRPYYPGVYTRVPGFINWITQSILNN